MKLSMYNDIIQLMHSYGSRDCIRELARLYPNVSTKTLGSIYSQDYQKKMRKCHYKHYAPDTMEHYYQRFAYEAAQGRKQILLGIADEVDFSPALLARIILERHLAHTQYEDETPPRTVVSQLLKDTTLIDDPVLAEEIHLCVISDDNYGPLVDTIKRSIGHEYEFKLKHIIEQKGFAYLGEDHLRAKGYDKTPDIKLEIPIAVDGLVVNWIESKASFGDETSHNQYLKDQFWSYWNRFGPGLVIYWFGFIDELDIHRDKGIMLKDDFPAEVVTMNPCGFSSTP